MRGRGRLVSWVAITDEPTKAVLADESAAAGGCGSAPEGQAVVLLGRVTDGEEHEDAQGQGQPEALSAREGSAQSCYLSTTCATVNRGVR